MSGTHNNSSSLNANALKLGVIGGGLGSAVGRAHHVAAQMDGLFRITAGCFSTRDAINQATAAAIGIPTERAYPDWQQLLLSEKREIDAVLLLTPTPMHAEMVVEALKLRIPVICEKALSVSSEEAAYIRRMRDECNGYVAVTYNYSGYPMVRELRHIIASGKLGKIINVTAEMPQEGFLRLVGFRDEKPKPQAWRMKDHFIPTVSLDLGVHIHHLIHFVTGESPIEVCAMEQSHGHFHNLIDEVQCLARYSNDLPVQIWFGKTSLGHANGLRIRVFGTQAAAEWVQMNPEHLTISDNRGTTFLVTRSSNGVHICNQDRYARFKAGHPAGFVEAFANYYADIEQSLRNRISGKPLSTPYVAGVELAEEGLRMMEAIARSSRDRSWHAVKA
jgi:predicted dehydrogenase